MLPDPNPRKDIYRTKFRIHPLIQQKIIARKLLWEKVEAARRIYLQLEEDWGDLHSQIEDELLRISQGKDPWSDPI